MPLRDLACAALGWALAVAVWVAASRVPRSMLSDAVGAEGFPKGLAILLAAVSTLIAARALLDRGRTRKRETDPFSVERPAALSSERKRGLSPFLAGQEKESFLTHAKASGIALMGFGYVLLAPWLGYPPAVALLIFVAAVYYGARPSLTLAAVALAGAAFLWFVFARLLSISMPTGIWARLFG